MPSSSRADADDKFLLDMALATGFRDGELMHAAIDDLKDNMMAVVDKPQFDWHPKHHHLRMVPVGDFAKDILARANGRTSGLLFPSKSSPRRPDRHLLRRLQRLTRGEFHSELHILRKTFASRLYRQTKDLILCQQLLGHLDIQTTRMYLEDVIVGSKETHDAVSAARYVYRPRPTLVEVA